jgi:hypothetical protein
MKKFIFDRLFFLKFFETGIEPAVLVTTVLSLFFSTPFPGAIDGRRDSR